MKRILSLLIAMTMLCTMMLPVVSAAELSVQAPESVEATVEQVEPEVEVPAEPEAAPAEPEVAPAEPEVAPVEPEVAPVEPEVAPAEPEAAPAEPEVAPAEPEVAPVEPEVAPAEPEAAPAEPEVAPAEPEVAPVEPEVAPAEPEVAPAEPEVAPAEPEAAPVEPEAAPVEPEAAPVEPEVDGPVVQSLRPMEEIHAQVLMFGYTQEQCRAFSVDTFVQSMLDREGNALSIPADATHVWFSYNYDEFREEFHNLNQGETVDLWQYRGWMPEEDEYSLTLVVGNGKQLDDAGNTRYLVDVSWKESPEWSSHIEVNVRDTGANYSRATYEQYSALPFVEQYGMTGLKVDSWITPRTEQGFQVEIGGYDFARDGLIFTLYPMQNVLDHLQNGTELTGAYVPKNNSRYQFTGDFTLPVEDVNASNLWCAVFQDLKTKETLAYTAIGVQVHTMPAATVEISAYENGQMVSLAEDGLSMNTYQQFKLRQGTAGYRVEWQSLNKEDNNYTVASSSYMQLPAGYSLDRDYYMSLPADIGIQKVTHRTYQETPEGYWQEVEEDITSQILVAPGQAAPYGWKHNWSEGEGDTWAWEEFKITWASGAEIITSMSLESFEDVGPGPGPNPEIDINFNLYGAQYQSQDSYRNYLDTYTDSSVRGQALDTYYRYDEKYDVGGYKLMLIKERFDLETNPKDLKKVMLEFSTPTGVQINSGMPLKSGVTTLENAQWSDKIANTVLIQAHVPGQKVKNYQVTLATLQAGASLFVAGPDERFVNLTADNGYIHDILIANLGEEALTGLNVELIDPVNVKLDDYWRVGGAGNDTLAAFTTTNATYDYTDEQGNQQQDYQDAMLKNTAKIRLLPAGSGEISGTLRVTAANGQQRDIKLTGVAGLPGIVSGQPDAAVKYVPYSFVVGTDNMYKWNTPTFHLTAGALPQGVVLREKTGEIYGVPQETGTFTFTVTADFSNPSFPDSACEMTLEVLENTNDNVYNETDPGYTIETHIGTEQGAGTHDYLLENIYAHALYVSEAEFYNFMDLWLNGEKLVEGVDYAAESGSTRITIYSQTFVNKARRGEQNTLAAEFRVDGDETKELKRTAQNFRISAVNVPVQPENPAPVVPGPENPAPVTPAKPAVPKANDVHMRIYLVDEDGKAMPDALVEIHSVVKTGTTDRNGYVVFNDVKFGQHTMKVKNAAGELLAEKAFTLADGAAHASADTIRAKKGGSVVLRVRVEGDTIRFISATAPATGDASQLSLWMMLMLLSAVCGAGCVLVQKKNR